MLSAEFSTFEHMLDDLVKPFEYNVRSAASPLEIPGLSSEIYPVASTLLKVPDCLWGRGSFLSAGDPTRTEGSFIRIGTTLGELRAH